MHCGDKTLGPTSPLCVLWVLNVQLLLGLGSKPNDTIRIYFICSLGFGVIMMTAVSLSIWQLVTGR